MKILDFGLARETDDDAHLTKTGAAVGTPAYMSPEQALCKPLDGRTDLFSLGVVLYRLCTGEQPFKGAGTMAVLTSLAVDTPAPPRQLNPKVPEALNNLIQRLLEKDACKRLQSAAEAAEALSRIEGNASKLPEVFIIAPAQTLVEDPFANLVSTPSSVPLPEVGRPSKRRGPIVEPPARSKRWLWPALALGLLLLAGGGYLAFGGKRGGQPVVKNDPLQQTPTISPGPNEEQKPTPALLKAPFTKEQADKARAEWAAYLNVPQRRYLDCTGVKLETVLIPPGKFKMGTPGNTGSETWHDVTISKPFYMGVTETTQAQYEAVIGKNPSYFQPTGHGKDKLGEVKDTTSFPVEQVNWFEAETFCKAIGAQLPTEAQWEYACRAGTITEYHFGNALNGTQANCKGTEPHGTAEKGPNLQRTTKVKSYDANPFGLYDMHGNVWEWCRDWYVETTRDLGEKDPERKQQGVEGSRVMRGGCWVCVADHCRSALRGYGGTPGSRFDGYGFRVVLSP